MRLLNLMLGKGRGGIETMARLYHEALVAYGHTVLSLGHARGELAKLKPDFVPLTAAFNHDPLAGLRLSFICRHFKPDLVITHGNRASGLALSPLMPTRDTCVCVVHNFRHKPHLARAKAVLAVSSAVGAHVKSAQPSLDVYEMANFTHLKIHPVKSVLAKPLILGALGRLHKNKGFDILLEACALLYAQGFDFRLRLAGDGPEAGALAALAQYLGLAPYVTFCGWVEPDLFLKGLDLFILPSRIEPFGLVVIEAMAAGVPVLAADIDGPRSILNQGEFGGLFLADQPQDLAQTIFTTVSKPQALTERATRAQAHALVTYSQSAGAKRLDGFIREIALLKA
jgi:glycosyltransferase involved in cell wall biosynthesis